MYHLPPGAGALLCIVKPKDQDRTQVNGLGDDSVLKGVFHQICKPEFHSQDAGGCRMQEGIDLGKLHTDLQMPAMACVGSLHSKYTNK